MSDYIKLHRKVVDSDVYKMPPLYLRIFERLIMEACSEKKLIPTGTSKKLLLQGEGYTSLRTIAEWVSWYERGQKVTPNAKTIKAILDWLVEYNMIEIYDESNTKGTHYKVLNYEVYQCDIYDESNSLVTPLKPQKPPQITPRKSINPPGSEQEIVDFWNTQKLVLHKRITGNLQIALNKAMKLHPKDDIISAIAHYAMMYHDQTYDYCNYLWTLEKFLDEPRGVAHFMDDGQKWLNYQEFLRKKETPTEKNKFQDQCPDFL